MEHDLLTLVNDRVILQFREGCIFAKFHENKTFETFFECTFFIVSWLILFLETEFVRPVA